MNWSSSRVNELQTLFSIVYGIYFATTVSTSGRFHPFDTTAAIAGDRRAWARMGVALLFLDIVPFIYFLAVLDALASHSQAISQDWSDAFAVLFAGLGSFGLYRVFLAVVLIRRPKSSSKFLFYTAPPEVRDENLKKHLEAKELPSDTTLPASKVFWGGILWLGLCIAAFAIGLCLKM